MKRKAENSENYLDKIPRHNINIAFTTDEKNIVTLEIENKGIMNRVCQKLFKKPKISYIHLDVFGSFVWLLIDGKTDITKIGKEVENRFGEKAQPLYERLVQYFKTLESYGFIEY